MYRDYTLIFDTEPQGAALLFNQTEESFQQHANEIPMIPRWVFVSAPREEPTKILRLPEFVVHDKNSHYFLDALHNLSSFVSTHGTTNQRLEIARVFGLTAGIPSSVTLPSGETLDVAGDEILLRDFSNKDEEAPHKQCRRCHNCDNEGPGSGSVH